MAMAQIQIIGFQYMAKVLLINGSPRENGNTFTARRGGASAAFDRLNKYFTIHGLDDS